MFLRCDTCGGSAHPSLLHLHGLADRNLCYACTQRVVQARAATVPACAPVYAKAPKMSMAQAVAAMSALWRFAA